MIHILSCRPVGLRATASEAAELARLLERGPNGTFWSQTYPSIVIKEGTHEAAICAEALRRCYGGPAG